MLSNYQTTIAHSVSAFGIGLHSGKNVSITLKPMPANSGIIFKRTDVDAEKSIVKADFRNVVDTRMNTMIANEHGTKIGTIEHLMAALWGEGIDNLMIEIDGEEVPAMDGSSQSFIFLIECAGIKTYDARRKVIEILKPIEITEGGSHLKILPSHDFSIMMEIDFTSAAISKQSFGFKKQSDFKKEVSRARTFGFMSDIEKLKAAGLARGGSLENAIVIDNDKILNEDGLRYDNEFARHKVLDCIGDFFLSGHYIIGAFEGTKPSHTSNNKLLHALFQDDSAYRIVESLDNQSAA